MGHQLQQKPEAMKLFSGANTNLIRPEMALYNKTQIDFQQLQWAESKDGLALLCPPSLFKANIWGAKDLS